YRPQRPPPRGSPHRAPMPPETRRRGSASPPPSDEAHAWNRRASSGDVAYPGALRLYRLGRARRLEQLLPVALDTLQMRIHEIHRLDGIAARDRVKDPLMLGVRFAAAVGALKIDAPAFRRHQIEDAHDAVEEIVLGSID